MSRKIDVPLRIIGSALVVFAYFVLVHIDVKIGVALSLTGDVLALPFFIRTKAWDVVVMIGFLSFVSVSKLVETLIGV